MIKQAKYVRTEFLSYISTLVYIMSLKQNTCIGLMNVENDLNVTT